MILSKYPLQAALFSLAVAAQAAVPLPDLKVLTCDLPASTDTFFKLDKTLIPLATKKGDGMFTIAGPLQYDKLCLKEVAIIAAFGTFTVTASLCGQDPQPLLDYLKANRPDLKKDGSKTAPGMLGMYGTEKDLVMIYRGDKALQPKPDGKDLIYSCAKALSGPQ
ncbi:hypothetical protein [Chitinimonas sp.]|uniref:hypothetical protein n=1 Tax=Chitinimonas sp. TaxID=1934313 RepID=UPI002F953B3B